MLLAKTVCGPTAMKDACTTGRRNFHGIFMSTSCQVYEMKNMTTVQLIGEEVFCCIPLFSTAGISQKRYGQYPYSPQH